MNSRHAPSSNVTNQEGSLGVLESNGQDPGNSKQRQRTASDLVDILSSNELFHGLEAKAVAIYARRFDILQLPKGTRA